MKRKALKLLSIVLSNVMIFGTVLPASAYNLDENHNSIESVEYQNTQNNDFTNTSQIFAELASIYKVTIPKTVVLSGESKDATYFVKVEGDIAGYEQISVIPDESFNLYTKKKDPQKAFVSQDKTIWHVSDFDIDANGTISADGITAGKWTGNFNFNINFESNDTSEKVLGDIVLPVEDWNDDIVDESIEFKIGETAYLDITYENKNVSNDISLISSNPEVVEINNNKLKAIDVGQSTITMSYDTKTNGIKKQSFIIHVIKDSSEAHKHVAGDAIKENEIAATCKEEGSYDEVYYCTICNEEIIRINRKTNKTEHNYEEGVCTVCGDTLPALSVSASDFTGDYDTKAHSISVTSSGNTIQSSTDNKTWTTTNPTFTNAGTYTVYYKVSKDGYKTVTGSANIVINKANPTVISPTAKTGLIYTGSAQPLINAGTTNVGTMYYSLDNSSWTTTIPTGINAGSYIVYYKIDGNNNYNDINGSINVNINKKLADMSFSEIQTIAKQGKASESGIKIGDQIKINDSAIAQVTEIGNDYIEFMTTKPIISDFSNAVTVQIPYYSNVTGQIKQTNYTSQKSGVFLYPQVNYNNVNTKIISYAESDLKNTINEWLNTQSTDFKSALKNTSRTYETAKLTYDTNTHLYTQSLYGTTTITEKIYIPTKEDIARLVRASKICTGVYAIRIASMPYVSSEQTGSAYGYFYETGANSSSFVSSGGSLTKVGASAGANIVVMFRIG